MRFTPTLVLFASTAALACSGDGVWYRAEQDPLGLAIAKADLTEDTCNILVVSRSEQVLPESIIDGIDINVDGVVVAGLYEGSSARACQSSLDGATPVETVNGSGHIRLEQASVEGFLTACRVDVKVDIGDVRYRTKDLYVWETPCEPVPDDTNDYTKLSAAYPGTDNRLTIAGWDPVNDACGWMQFQYFGYTDSPLDVPTGWGSLRPTVSDVDENQCDAKLIANAAAEATTSMGLGNVGGGSLKFVESRPSPDDAAVDVPCVIEIDAWLQHFASYYWVPERVGFSGTVEVEGACP